LIPVSCGDNLPAPLFPAQLSTAFPEAQPDGDSMVYFELFSPSIQPIYKDYSGYPHLLTNVLATFLLDTSLTAENTKLFSGRSVMSPHLPETLN
jgi:hypothetical protein